MRILSKSIAIVFTKCQFQPSYLRYSLEQAGGMGRPDGRISEIAQHSAMYCAHRIRMLLGFSNDFHRRGARTDFDQLEAEQSWQLQEDR